MNYWTHALGITSWVVIVWAAILIIEGLRVSSVSVKVNKPLPFAVKRQVWIAVAVEILAWAWVTR